MFLHDNVKHFPFDEFLMYMCIYKYSAFKFISQKYDYIT